MSQNMIDASAPYALPELKDRKLTKVVWQKVREAEVLKRVPGAECPRCAHGMIAAQFPEDRRYIGCKFCGLWQEVGGMPYECILVGHHCFGNMVIEQWVLPWDKKRKCDDCGHDLKKLLTYYQQITAKNK